MRHGISGNRLGRNSGLRKATIRDLAKATLIQQRICTTKALAKEARKLVDKLITLGKNGTLADKRRAFALLCNHQLVSELFNKTAVRFKNRVGGYTRIIPAGNRRGDNAQLAFLELTEKEEVVVSKPKSEATSKKENLKVKSVKTDIKEEQTPEVKSGHEEQHLKKDVIKGQPQKGVHDQEKAKPGKSAPGGLRKLFQRKTGGGN